MESTCVAGKRRGFFPASLARRGLVRICAALCVVALLSAMPRPARADDGTGEAIGYLFLGIVVSPFVNLAYIASGESPPWEWVAGGVVSGLLLGGLGVAGLSEEWMSVGASVGMITWGALCLGLAIAAAGMPAHRQRSGQQWALLTWR